VAGIDVEVVEKRVTRLSLRVYPPDGRVRLTVPPGTPAGAIRKMVAERAEWIRTHQTRFRSLPQPEATLYVSGETHFVDGVATRLELQIGATKRAELNGTVLTLHATAACDRRAREATLENFYRRRLQAALPPLVSAWSERLALPLPEFRVKRMSTRWGSCNPQARRIWLNLALARRRPELLEYVVVHELAHLRVPDHGPRFKALMTSALPTWRELDRELDGWPIWARTPRPQGELPS
jgi:predicted metal-dependent hydrolase